MSQKNSSYNDRAYNVTGRGANSRGNKWDNPDYTASTGGNQVNDNTYHYSNSDGSYYYSNANGSTYYNNGRGLANYKAPNGGWWTSYTPPDGKK